MTAPSPIPAAAAADAPAEDGDEDAFARRLEREGLIVLGGRPFALTPAEADLLDPAQGDGRAKSISLGPDGVRGAGPGAARDRLAALMGRYGDWARGTLAALAPRYGAWLETGRTSLRLRSVAAGALSPRKDDRRLHVDAFASQPTRGRRILRVFTNVDPAGEARLWRVGEPFEAHARRFLARARPPIPGEAALLHRLGVTRAKRRPYDHYMLQLHDGAKLDAAYQAQAAAREVAFAAGSSWIVYTDAVVHAAIGGRFALEQTFYLPLAAMAAPEAAPARVLERLTGKAMV